jgi:hypothetical protein
MTLLITARDRLQQARGLGSVLDGACDAFEDILTVIGKYEGTTRLHSSTTHSPPRPPSGATTPPAWPSRPGRPRTGLGSRNPEGARPAGRPHSQPAPMPTLAEVQRMRSGHPRVQPD